MLTLLFLLAHCSYDPDIRGIERFIEKKLHVRIETVTVKTTAYFSPSPQQRNYKKLVKLNGKGVKTSTGVIPQEPTHIAPGTVAADPGIPYGTIMFIPNYGVGIVEDRGGSIKGDRLDLYCGKGEHAYREAKKWGVQRIKIVRIIPEDKKRSL